MKSPMRLTPAASIRGATSTSTNAIASGSPSVSAIAVSDAMPPSDAPTSAGGCGIERAMARTSREGIEAVVAVGCPGAVAVAAEIDRVRAPVLTEHAQRRSPRVAGLPAAVEQHDGWRRRVAHDVGRELQPVVTRKLDRLRGHRARRLRGLGASELVLLFRDGNPAPRFSPRSRVRRW